MINPNILLTGQLVQLEPLQEEQRAKLKALSLDDRISVYSPALKLKFDSWFDKALKKLPESDQFTFIIRHLTTKEIVGSTRFYDICFNHKRLTLGYTWLIPDAWGTGINLDCKLLLLNYVFDTLQLNRVEFQIDARNERSRHAVKKLGAVEEGILRQHIILEDGYVRDTVIYSIVKSDWQTLRYELHEKGSI